VGEELEMKLALEMIPECKLTAILPTLLARG
jgi:hypothetical protein